MAAPHPRQSGPFKRLALLLAVGLILSATGCGYARIGQNESAIKTTNGIISDDHVEPGLHWYFTAFGVNRIEFPRISHTVQSLPITAVDRGQHCDKDCVTLQTHDNQTVTGSLVLRYHVERNSDNHESVMAELYRLRGATDQLDLEEKLLVPPILDCMINVVNHTDAKDLVERDADTIKSIKECVVPRLQPYHVAIEEVFNRGFGPSTEARASMKKFSDARQEGQVAQIQLDTAEKRQLAAIKNSEVMATAYNQLLKLGIPKDQIPQLICLSDASSRERPCIPQTAMGALSVTPPR